MLIPDSPPLLQIRQVFRRRGGRAAVSGLDLALRRGEVVGLLGINGAGKSTTLSMMAGALAPDRGRITLDGTDFVEHPELARHLVGWLPERAPVWPELTVIEHLHAHGRLRGLAGAKLRETCARVLEQLELQALGGRLAGALSQGQRQRLGLACALLHAPALLVLDEPASALDPVQVAGLRKLIRTQAAAGTAVILSTHVLAEVTSVCDRVAIMHGGVLRHDGPVGSGGQADLEHTFFDIAMRGPDAASTPGPLA
jgi:ABC-2 type transport system ATP-binding protein